MLKAKVSALFLKSTLCATKETIASIFSRHLTSLTKRRPCKKYVPWCKLETTSRKWSLSEASSPPIGTIKGSSYWTYLTFCSIQTLLSYDNNNYRCPSSDESTAHHGDASVAFLKDTNAFCLLCRLCGMPATTESVLSTALIRINTANSTLKKT